MRTARPAFDDVCKVAGYIACSCGAILGSFDQVREHWSRGHFDYMIDDRLLDARAAIAKATTPPGE